MPDPAPIKKSTKTSLTLGKFLRIQRERSGLSLIKAAKALGLKGSQFLWNLENERSVPPLLLIKKMSKVYGVSSKQFRIEVVKFLNTRNRRKYGFK